MGLLKTLVVIWPCADQVHVGGRQSQCWHGRRVTKVLKSICKKNKRIARTTLLGWHWRNDSLLRTLWRDTQGPWQTFLKWTSLLGILRGHLHDSGMTLKLSEVPSPHDTSKKYSKAPDKVYDSARFHGHWKLKSLETHRLFPQETHDVA